MREFDCKGGGRSGEKGKGRRGWDDGSGHLVGYVVVWRHRGERQGESKGN